MRRFPDKPWRLILYLDDLGVGAALKADNRRNLLAIYISFLEFGTNLSDESMWLPLGVFRVSEKRKFGTSALCKAVLLYLFPKLSEDGWDINGIRFRAKFHRALLDDAAGKECFKYKGASGIKMCHQCKNIVAPQGGGESCLASYDAEGYLQPASCSDVRLFDPQSSEDRHSAVNHVLL